MKFLLEIDCDNAALEDQNLPLEVGRILRRTAERLANERDEWANVPGEVEFAKLLDVNGNTVGQFGFTDD